MSGQRGAGNSAIPTLAFADLEAFCQEAQRRGLGQNDLNAIRVQSHAQMVSGCTCYTVAITAFDDRHGCILALRLEYGCYPTDTARPDLKRWAQSAGKEIAGNLYRDKGFVVCLGEWVHDPIPPGMAIDMLASVLEAGRKGHEMA